MSEQSKGRYFTWKTKQGSKRLRALFICLILLCSFFARLVQTDFGAIKVEQITIDARGAELTAELYYPAGTTSKNLYPGIVITHGGGCTFMSSRIWAEELARRDFVVLNVSAYGAGMSAQPTYDENDQGVEGLNGDLTPMGLIDAKNFLSSLTFVDSTRIGMAGHSMGSRRTGYAAVMDCGYFTLNDRLVNILYHDFGLTLTEAEIYEDAYTLAEQYLNADQLEHFNDLAAAATEDYNSELQAICLIGGDAPVVNQMQTVQVAGFDVLRNCQVNMGLLNGDFDTSYYDFNTRDTTKESWHTGTEDVVLETWYSINDETATSEQLGQLYGTSSGDNEALSAALYNKSMRILIRNNETHSKNFYSNDTTSDLVKYFEQALQYNRGDLSDSSTVPLDASNLTWMWRALFNLIAMLSMFGMLISLAALIFKSDKYAECVVEAGAAQDKPKVFHRTRYWIFNAITVVLSFCVIYLTNKNGFTLYNPGPALPLGRTATLTVYFLLALTIMSLILLAAYMLFNKKDNGTLGLRELNIAIAPRKALKCIFAAFLLLCAAYGSLMVIEYLFAQDYRGWMTVFSDMKGEYWVIGLRYVVFIFPMYLIMGAAINFTVRNDIPQWKDTLITVITNSLGIWICCLINILLAKTSYDGTLFSSFICSYQFLLCVPLTVYISRKLYNMTKNIWTGAALNAFVIVWSMMCALGINDVYYGQTWISNFLNI